MYIHILNLRMPIRELYKIILATSYRFIVIYHLFPTINGSCISDVQMLHQSKNPSAGKFRGRARS